MTGSLYIAALGMVFLLGWILYSMANNEPILRQHPPSSWNMRDLSIPVDPVTIRLASDISSNNTTIETEAIEHHHHVVAQTSATTGGTVSSFERIVRDYLVGHDMWFQCRPDWLLSPIHNRPMEIDIYLPRLRMGVEVNGQGHYKPAFGHSPDEQIRRDAHKARILADNGVYLLSISYENISNNRYREIIDGALARRRRELNLVN